MGCLRNLKIADSKSATQFSSSRPVTVRSGWRLLAPVLASLLTFTGTTQAQENQDGFYVGVFSGPGVLDVQSTDLDGFTGSQGVPGQSFEYDDTGFPTGVVAGRHFHLGRVPIRFEVDGAFVGLPSASRQMDPVGMDETATSELRLGRDGAHWRSEAFRACRCVPRRRRVGCRYIEFVHRSRPGNRRPDAGGSRRFIRRSADARRVGRGHRHRYAGGRRLEHPIRRSVRGYGRDRPPGPEPAWRQRGRLRTRRSPEPMPLWHRSAVRPPPPDPCSQYWPMNGRLISLTSIRSVRISDAGLNGFPVRP